MAQFAGIKSNNTENLYQWLRLGYGQEVAFTQVGGHTSKSHRLPILAVNDPKEDVDVTWFGDNFYFHFLGVSLRHTLPAILMYPISSIFGQYPLSGHVNTQIAPPVNFLTAYYRKQRLERFGSDTGDGFSAALVIRYLRALSKLNIPRIMDICFEHTNHGPREEIDGNAIDSNDLLETLGLTINKHPYDPALTGLPTDVFETIVVDLFEKIVHGQSAVRIKLSEETLLPPMPFPYQGICVDLQETILDQFVPETVHERPYQNQYKQFVVSYLPVSLLSSTFEGGERFFEAQQQSATPVSGIYKCLNRLTREFVFSTPNILDAALTAFFLVKAVAPTIQAMR